MAEFCDQCGIALAFRESEAAQQGGYQPLRCSECGGNYRPQSARGGVPSAWHQTHPSYTANYTETGSVAPAAFPSSLPTLTDETPIPLPNPSASRLPWLALGLALCSLAGVLIARPSFLAEKRSMVKAQFAADSSEDCRGPEDCLPPKTPDTPNTPIELTSTQGPSRLLKDNAPPKRPTLAKKPPKRSRVSRRRRTPTYEAMLKRATRLRRAKRFGPALDVYGAAAAKKPRSAEPLSGKGWCYLSLGHPQAALLSFQKAVDVNQRFADAHLGLGMTFLRLNQDSRAKEALEAFLIRAPAADPSRARVQRTLARLDAR